VETIPLDRGHDDVGPDLHAAHASLFFVPPRQTHGWPIGENQRANDQLRQAALFLDFVHVVEGVEPASHGVGDVGEIRVAPRGRFPSDAANMHG
jgi:hypothetical protein